MKDIIIRNRDFSELTDQTSRNKYDMTTKVYNVGRGWISIYTSKRNDEQSALSSSIHTDQGDEYLKDELKRFGFNIKFKSVDSVTTNEDFLKFISKIGSDQVYYCGKGIFNRYDYKLGMIIVKKDQIEKEYNVKINFEND